MIDPRKPWFDEAAGPLVRPFAVTRGRTRSVRPDLGMLTQVMTTQVEPDLRRLEPEYREIVRLCERPQSIAEISARLHLVLMVAKILVGDLIADGYLVFRTAAEDPSTDIDMLWAVLNGIRKL
ncbi:DUF742 domain-containing protein [Nocardia sp. alder85J]|uniref:DUF742 domain-containing protein n=1 Tax=Nocardia sp. alder85J TaxID=2862949 RepID=UPI001CD26995|nr:DUF742 domain-containing protein [Nocardia sp. alder85J]MCX4095651.1 DUF742 domain-containing protein [Nocardia sp. alder85J]